jgi:hypothetical protein
VLYLERNKMTKVIKSNKARCKLCGDIIESRGVHDFQSCQCEEIFVDGGHEYLRRGANDLNNIEERSIELDITIGTQLFTRDGMKIGNAIIIQDNGDKTFKVKSDFGNVRTYDVTAIDSLFQDDIRQCDLIEWINARRELT